jgi:putative membrane protein
MLWLTSYLSVTLGFGLRIDGFMSAFLGALVVTVVSFVLSAMFVKKDEDRRRKD